MKSKKIEIEICSPEIDEEIIDILVRRIKECLYSNAKGKNCAYDINVIDSDTNDINKLDKIWKNPFTYKSQIGLNDYDTYLGKDINKCEIKNNFNVNK